MVVFGQCGCIRARLLLSGKVVVIRAKVVVVGQKWLYSAKRDCIQIKLFVFGQCVVIGQSGCIRAKVVAFGQK